MQNKMFVIILLVIMNVAVQLIRCRKMYFYAPIEKNPKMKEHILNQKYRLTKERNVDYKSVNRYYMTASLLSFFLAAVIFAYVSPFLGILTFFTVYALFYGIVSKMIGKCPKFVINK